MNGNIMQIKKLPRFLLVLGLAFTGLIAFANSNPVAVPANAPEAPSGRVDTLSIQSQAMKKPMKFVVIQPSVQAPEGGFPVVYLLHGMGGRYDLWVTKVPQLQSAADRYGCLIVCPDGGRQTFYFNNPFDSSYRFETHFVQELIPYIDQHYPTNKDRKFRAISGLSMGGFGALFLASRHPALFAAAGSMSGALLVDNMTKTILAKNGRPASDTACCAIDWNRLQAYSSSDSTRTQTIALSLECGTEDYLLSANRAARKKLIDLKIAHEYTERPGKHTWDYWQNAVDYQLLFFRKRWDSFLQNQ